MPHALTTDTAATWTKERAVSLFALYAGDLPEADLMRLHGQSGAARGDGARFVVIVPEGSHPNPAEMIFADLFVESAAPPSPFGLFVAMQASGVTDARKLAVIAACPATVEAGHRAGAAAIVAVAPPRPAARTALLEADPDVIIAADEFLDLDRERFASVRLQRLRLDLTIGSTLVSDRVRRAAAGVRPVAVSLEHRALVEGIGEKLRTVAGIGAEWRVALLPGNGDAAAEVMVASLARPGRRLLICRNGEGGERLVEIVQRSGIAHGIVEAPTGTPIDPRAVIAALDRDPGYDAVAVVHHETGAGLLNPVAAIAAAAGERNVLIACDATGSLGVEDVTWSGFDLVAGSADGPLHGLPGTAFVLASPRGWERVAQAPPRSVALDLTAHAGSERVVASPSLLAFDAALAELLEEGVHARRASYRARAALLDEELERLGLAGAVAPDVRSASVRLIALPDGVAAPDLLASLQRSGYVLSAASGGIAVGFAGPISPDALRGFIAALERALSGAPVPSPTG